jgi:mRNA interferase YafQ
MRKIIPQDSFTKSAKRYKKKHYDFSRMQKILAELATLDSLEGRYRDHALVGNLSGYRELHIEPNVLLIYKLTDSEIILVLMGSHDELFK